MSERPSKLPKDLERELMPAYQKAVIEISSIVVPTNFEYKEKDIDSITYAVTDLFSALTPEFKDKDWSKTFMFVEFVCSKLITAMSKYEEHQCWPNPEFYFYLVYPLLLRIMKMDELQTKQSGNTTCVVSIAHVAELWWKGLIHFRAYPVVPDLHRSMRDSIRDYVRNIGNPEYMRWDGPLHIVFGVMDRPSRMLLHNS